MSTANILWGAPRIAGELRMLGIELAESTIPKYMVKRPRPASPTWTTFLRSHIRDMISVDFFIVPTIRNQILFVFLVLSNERRQVLQFNVTTNPTAEWTGRQLLEAFAWIDVPRYLLRDNDQIYGSEFQRQAEVLGLTEIRSGKGKPWQNPYVERLIGTIRRECLDHVIVLNEQHLKRVLREYLAYYTATGRISRWRWTHRIDGAFSRSAGFAPCHIPAAYITTTNAPRSVANQPSRELLIGTRPPQIG